MALGISIGIGVSTIAAAAGAGGAEPLPIAGEYIQPFTYADGTQLISLPGWTTYGAAGVTTTATQIGYAKIKSNTLASSPKDYGANLSHLREVGSANQCVRFKIAGFFDDVTDTTSSDANIRVIFGATDHQNSLYFQATRVTSAIPFVKIFKRVAGTDTEVGSVSPGLNAPDFPRKIDAGDTIEINLRGNVVHLYCNGVRLTPVAGWTVTGYTPGTRAGISSNCWDVRLDDFYCAPLTAHSVNVAPSLSFWPAAETGRLVTVTGTTTGTPTYLQTRVISAVDHSEVVPWTTNATAVFGAGTFSVSVFEPIGDLATRARYITQVRPVDDINGWSAGNAHAVGPAFLFYGQSNSSGRDAGGVTVTGAQNAYLVKAADTGNNTSSNPWQRGSSQIGGLAQFAKTASDRLGVPVGIICCGVGAQTAAGLAPSAPATFGNDWGPAANPWNIMLAACTKVQALGYVRGMHWTQGEGEADAFSTAPALGYLPYFQETATAFRANIALDANAPITITVIGSYEGTPSNGATQANINWPLMRETLFGLPAQVSNCHVSSSLMHIPHGDAFHYTSVGMTELNRRDAQTAAKLMGASTYDGRGPIITGGTRAGAVITMAVNLNGAASIAGSAVTGFDVSADNFATLLTVSSVNVSGSTVVITLAADPGGPVKVRSYWGYRPTQSSVITGTYSDGTTIQAEPIYNPITVS